MPRQSETIPSPIERLQQGDREVLIELYRENERMVRKYISENSGSADDAEDLLQDALVILWQNARKPDFQLHAKISTYLFAIVRNQWLKNLEKRKRENGSLEKAGEGVPTFTDEFRLDLQIVRDYLNDMGDLCRKILLMYYFDGFDMQTIADANELANANTAKSKKYQCLKELGNKIKTKFNAGDFLTS
jgi:RNA polymerase sigma factor (sigma-70 family)